jgi:hypothetical protein
MDRVRRHLPWLAAYVAVAAAVQWWATNPWDADTGYHVAVARLIASHGILRAFPWTPFSWLAERYADKELLFHLAMVPLAGLDWVTAAKIIGTVAGALLLATQYGILRASDRPAAGWWPLVALASSGYFVMRFALVRPHVVAIALALLVTWAAARRRYVLLLAAAVVYPWSYVAWHMALVLAGVVELAAVLAGRRPEWRTLAVVAAGLLVGLVVHPNFPAIVELAKLQSWDVLVASAWGGRAGLEQGTEFLPFDAEGLVRVAAVPLAAVAVALVLALRARWEDPVPLAFALAATAWVPVTLASQRFIEYLVPFAFTALALALPRHGARVATAAAGAVAIGWTALLGRLPVESLRTRQLDFPPATEAALRATVPEGAQVFTCGWLATGEMMLALPERKFMVALDPVFFLVHDEARYRRWFTLVHAPPDSPARVVREEFGAEFVLCELGLPANLPLVRRLAAEPGVRIAFSDPTWILLDLRPERR